MLSAALVSADTIDYWKSFTSKTNPLNVSIPSITQTTSLDPFKECVYYNPDPAVININPAEWPTVWVKATSNGMNETEEFRNLYNSIDWSKAPDIPVRTAVDGVLDMSGYNATADPDCWWSASGCVTPKLPDVNKDIYYCPEPETWGLTYDDGPNCSHNAFYDFLQEKELKATLFYIGSNVIDWPYGAMRGIKDGHQIACHTWSHPLMTTFTNEEVLAEFYYAQKAIKLATGLTPRFWRPPYGDIDNRVRWIATQLGLTAVVWSEDTNDWSAVSPATIPPVEQNYEAFIEMGKNGTFAETGNIVLSHELTNITMSLAMKYLPDIMSSYKHVVNVATCHNISYPYFEDFEWTPVMNGTSKSTIETSKSTTTTTDASKSTTTDASKSDSDSSKSDSNSSTSDNDKSDTTASKHNAIVSAGNAVRGSSMALLGALAAAIYLI
ncbi:chitin deacetylase 2 [Cokeromyces recurvatus]|uniref:chitin deacetylase 2 n=1 Tax=Cokeromyces recurvatus TaxID=90255 RepID=UPI00221E61E5|nr:chitin deacetylase 2 [Cokeromyces recurvatus]KAI7906997.1 chitin deacetylase 2 [Cokeromyces recurvatus]